MADFSAEQFNPSFIPSFTQGDASFWLITPAEYGYADLINATPYYLMEAYDTAALVWKQWVAIGAPDPSASQYPGPAFPFTAVSILRTWIA